MQHRDRTMIFVAAFLRATAVGLIGVLLAIYLAKLAIGKEESGVIIGVGLGGATCAALVATFFGDVLGRRRVLIGVAILGAIGALVAAGGSTSPIVIGIAAFAGMLNGMGRDRGASLVIEQAILPSTTDDKERTRVFAWYNVLQDAGHALGSLLGAMPAMFRRFGVGELESFQYTIVFYAVLIAACAIMYLFLTPEVEAKNPTVGFKVSPESKKILTKISALFFMDSLGGGFLTTALFAYFFFERFGVGEEIIAALFFGARVLNAFSHLGASWLAKRIGLVKTMVYTHIPSSLLLLTVAYAPSFPIAALIFLVREGLVEMDVPTRQSYVMAVVRPEERTAASGVTHVVRIGAWAVAPSFAGLFMGMSMGTPLLISAGIKIAYDVLLYRAFNAVRPPEER